VAGRQDFLIFFIPACRQVLNIPGPDLACNAEAVLPGLINNIDIAIFAEEVALSEA